MDFAGMNYVAIIAAAIASFMFGALWYGALSKPWMEAVGKSPDELSNASPAMLIAAGSQLVMAFVLAGLIGHLGEGQVTMLNGIISAAFVWTGFVLTTLLTNHAFQDGNWKLAAIDGGHWLGVLLVQGAIIGWLGV